MNHHPTIGMFRCENVKLSGATIPWFTSLTFQSPSPGWFRRSDRVWERHRFHTLAPNVRKRKISLAVGWCDVCFGAVTPLRLGRTSCSICCIISSVEMILALFWGSIEKFLGWKSCAKYHCQSSFFIGFFYAIFSIYPFHPSDSVTGKSATSTRSQQSWGKRRPPWRFFYQLFEVPNVLNFEIP